MTLVPSLCFLPGYFQTSVVNEQQYNNTQTGAHEHRSQNPVVCRKTVERISWRVRYFFLESPVFLPGESGISSWGVRCFFLESPVFLPGESGISSWRVRYFFLGSPVFLPREFWQSREHPWKSRGFRS